MCHLRDTCCVILNTESMCIMLFDILKALSGKTENNNPTKKTKAQIDKEKRELERKLREMAEEYEEEE